MLYYPFFRVQKESVSHSFSVVSVKYSSSKAAAEAAEAASTSSEEVTWSSHSNTTTPVEEEEEEEDNLNLNQGAGLKQTLPRVDSSTVVTTREEFTQQDDDRSHHSSEAEAIEAVFANDQRAPKAIVSNEHQSNDRQKFLNSFPQLSVTESQTASTTTSTSKPVITTKEAITEAEETVFTTPAAEVLEDTEAPSTSAPSHRKVSLETS